MPAIPLTGASAAVREVNNFLKNDTEIVSDFKMRMAEHRRQMDRLQSSPFITYNRIINSMTTAECSGFLSAEALFMEENY